MIYKCISEVDPEINDLIQKERLRQQSGLELIASENFTSISVLQANSSILTNKYSEGYVYHRYYGGNEHIDEIERICQERALDVFELDHDEWGVNVQSYSGSPANFAVYTGLIGPNGKMMGLDLPSGGHLTHGYQTAKKKISATSIFFQSCPYTLNENNELDYDMIRESFEGYKPDIFICGASAFSRDFDYEKLREIASTETFLMADIAHISGMVIAKTMNNPFKYCDIVTTTTHKTLRGPRGALIFYRKSGILNGRRVNMEEKINFAVFPGLQGGPHNQTIAAIAVALKQAMSPEFKKYIIQVQKNATVLADELKKKQYKILTDGTDCHLILVDFSSTNLSGAMVEKICEMVNITINKNTLPNATSAMNPKGVRLGTSALTTRGFLQDDFRTVACLFDRAVKIGLDIFESLKLKKNNEKITLKEFNEECNENKEVEDLRNVVIEFSSAQPIPYFEYRINK